MFIAFLQPEIQSAIDRSLPTTAHQCKALEPTNPWEVFANSWIGFTKRPCLNLGFYPMLIACLQCIVPAFKLFSYFCKSLLLCGVPFLMFLTAPPAANCARDTSVFICSVLNNSTNSKMLGWAFPAAQFILCHPSRHVVQNPNNMIATNFMCKSRSRSKGQVPQPSESKDSANMLMGSISKVVWLAVHICYYDVCLSPCAYSSCPHSSRFSKSRW